MNKLEAPNDGRDMLRDYGDWELFTELMAFFGPQRTIGLVGWSVIWALTGVKDVSALRKDLEARGVSKSATYRAVADLKQFHAYLVERRGYSMDMTEVIKEISELSSHNREKVLQ